MSQFESVLGWVRHIVKLLLWSFNEAPTDPLVPIGWLRNSRYIIIFVAIIFAISFATRYWALRILVLARRRRLVLQESSTDRIKKGFREGVVTVAVRYFSNTTLVSGTLIVFVILLAALRPQAIAPYTPDERGRLLQEIRGKTRAAPFPPNVRYPLGTDQNVRDIFSRIVYGTVRTLEICIAATLLRLLVGGSLGAIAGWRRGALGQQILSFSAVSASIPALLFAYVVIIAIGPRQGFGVFLVALGLTGWAELTNVVNGAVRWITAQPYMDGARAIGSSPRHLIRRHLFPGLAPQLLPATSLEFSAVLLMLAELGFLGVFLGERAAVFLPQEQTIINLPEWAGMLAGTRLALFNTPWVPLGPALAFTVAILGFNLLAIGMREWLDPNRARGS